MRKLVQWADTRGHPLEEKATAAERHRFVVASWLARLPHCDTCNRTQFSLVDYNQLRVIREPRRSDVVEVWQVKKRISKRPWHLNFDHDKGLPRHRVEMVSPTGGVDCRLGEPVTLHR